MSKGKKQKLRVQAPTAAVHQPTRRRRRVLVAGVVAVAAVCAAAALWPQHAPVPVPVASGAEERPIPETPWPAEATGVQVDFASGLRLASPAVIDASERDIDASVSRGDFDQPGLAIRIDGSSVDSMVDSINKITAALPDEQAKAFQKAVRLIMVANLPIEQMRAQHILPETVPQEKLIAGARRDLSGRNALEVLQIAQAKLERYRAQQSQYEGGGPAPGAGGTE